MPNGEKMYYLLKVNLKMKNTQWILLIKMYMKNKGISLPPLYAKNCGTSKEKRNSILSNLNQETEKSQKQKLFWKNKMIYYNK